LKVFGIFITTGFSQDYMGLVRRKERRQDSQIGTLGRSAGKNGAILYRFSSLMIKITMSKIAQHSAGLPPEPSIKNKSSSQSTVIWIVMETMMMSILTVKEV